MRAFGDLDGLHLECGARGIAAESLGLRAGHSFFSLPLSLSFSFGSLPRSANGEHTRGGKNKGRRRVGGGIRPLDQYVNESLCVCVCVRARECVCACATSTEAQPNFRRRRHSVGQTKRFSYELLFQFRSSRLSPIPSGRLSVDVHRSASRK